MGETTRIIAIGGEIVNKIPCYYPPKSIGKIVRLMFCWLPLFGIWQNCNKLLSVSISDVAELQRIIISNWIFPDFFSSNWGFCQYFGFRNCRTLLSVFEISQLQRNIVSYWVFWFEVRFRFPVSMFWDFLFELKICTVIGNCNEIGTNWLRFVWTATRVIETLQN